jgi:hypothetical protein
MIYYEIIFEYGVPVSEGYQELNNEATEQIRLTDLDGNTLELVNNYGCRMKYHPPVQVTPPWA